jgi:hypothetical protein
MGVINEALTKIFADVGAVMIGLDVSRDAFLCFIRVDVEDVKEFADILERFELLIVGSSNM